MQPTFVQQFRTVGRTRGISFVLAFAGLMVAASVATGAPDRQRIVGGEVADPADWPFIAAITDRQGNQFCGGSVIAGDSVLTAAHCVYEAAPRFIRVVTGRPDLREESSGQVLKVDEIHVKGRYFLRGTPDLAVLKLKSPTLAPPVDLPTEPEDEAETAPRSELRVAGWGATKRNGWASRPKLRDDETRVKRARVCERAFKRFRDKFEICTRGEKMGANDASACYGDSGGPLVADGAGGPLLVGVVSYGGIRCGVDDPTVYGRTASALGFIHKKAGLTP